MAPVATVTHVIGTSPLLFAALLSAISESLLIGVYGAFTLAVLYFWLSQSCSEVQGDPSFSAMARIMSCTSALTRSPLPIGSIILFLMVLTHCIRANVKLLTIVSNLEVQQPPSTVYGNFTVSILAVLSVSIADLLLIWRLWVVSDRSLIVLPLVLAEMGFLACGTRFAIWAYFAKGAYDIFHPNVKSWILAATLLTALSNSGCSACLAYYICRRRSDAVPEALNFRKRILVIVVESAVLHTLWALLSLVTYVLESKYALLAWDTTPAVAGIAFMLINIRVVLGRDILASQARASWIDARAIIGSDISLPPDVRSTSMPQFQSDQDDTEVSSTISFGRIIRQW